MTLERTYTIPLRKAFMKAPKYRRAKRAVNALREFVQKHMKSDNVLIGPKLNLKIWEHGIKVPPHHVKVTAIKDEKEGTVRVELFGFEVKAKEKKEKKDKPEGLAGKIQEKLGGKEEKPTKKEEKTETTAHKEAKEVKEKKAPVNKDKPAEKKAQ